MDLFLIVYFHLSIWRLKLFSLFILLYLIYLLFMAVLGLRFCARAFSSCGKWGPLFIAVRGPLIIVASLVAEHRLQTRRLSSCGSRSQLLRGIWDLPRPGLEPVPLHWQADSQPLHHQGSPHFFIKGKLNPKISVGFFLFVFLVFLYIF